MTVHKKLLIKLKVFNRISWSWCYYNKEKMLYPARWKKITVDQSKVLKNRLFRSFWATRYNTWHPRRIMYFYNIIQWQKTHFSRNIKQSQFLYTLLFNYIYMYIIIQYGLKSEYYTCSLETYYNTSQIRSKKQTSIDYHAWKLRFHYSWGHFHYTVVPVFLYGDGWCLIWGHELEEICVHKTRTKITLLEYERAGSSSEWGTNWHGFQGGPEKTERHTSRNMWMQ